MRGAGGFLALCLAACSGGAAGEGADLRAQAERVCVETTMLDMRGLPAGTADAAQRTCACELSVMAETLTPEEFRFVAGNIVSSWRGGAPATEAQAEAVFASQEAKARMRSVADRTTGECYPNTLRRTILQE